MNRRQALLALAAAGVPAAAALVGLRRFGALRALVSPAAGAAPGFRPGRTSILEGRDFRALAVGPDGRAWVALESRLLGLDAAGAPAAEVRLPEPATAVAAGPHGELWVGTRTGLRLLGPGGWEADLGENAWVTSVAAGGEHVFAADAGNRVVWRFDRGGRLRGHLGGRPSSPDGFEVPSPFFDVAVRPGPGGEELWAANPGRHRVERRSAEGELRGAWGSFGEGPAAFGGCCNPSHVAVLPGGGFLTAEKGRPRVQLWDAQGRWLALVAGPGTWSPRTRWVEAAAAPDGSVLVLDPGAGAVRRFLPPRADGGPA